MPTWNDLIKANPGHSQRYAQRWEDFLSRGEDIVGEARLIDALSARSSSILDAGCGQGRLGGYLSQQGHRVTGIDLDPYLIELASQKYPEATWAVADLSQPMPKELELSGQFDITFSAGNVLTFIEPQHRGQAVANIAATLKPQGRAVIGFGAGRGYPFGQFFEHLSQAGLKLEGKYATWTLDPWTPDADFLVAIARRLD
ncbi:class I SAM-dependent methyltransferase [Corynebacterium sp. 153RC1]|uniref:class I SAM-dependent methyltransferase n=1 Tax=unclassified Corynebacterium TaxID=2624378 RepID=UPI00211C52A5|nr:MULTISPECIES: class I SAM-dependent methyltransferase [unclassified Corynebacterium]MCQ9352462.1 class I SAM-dependent methyltransferase [Corynebacterium sp. 209RC1]MCQ9354366.1 class I SAM-dependent methyltransferase [Corynebacterium sp. 1222RC1]MCQ9356745.1 class I SAM-dependent methyltransferase [Corynebacterium sp. 122RC1]MCQ9358761.1 class I SAM-dependent methyltransferase [Corynebacterium sp. 142RC1]MCQ9361159.1 class I SAM-dependent methyltransferase [Corynebacterium sp. 153RC1]